MKRGQYVTAKWRRYKFRGWYVRSRNREGGESILIELDPKRKYSFSGHSGGGYIPANYKERGEGKFWWVDSIETKSFKDSDSPSHNYSVTKRKKVDAVKVGELWVTQVEKKPKM